MAPGFEASHRYQPPDVSTFSNATHMCICEVDIETGLVSLERFVVSEDCGRMINPMVVDGQIAGGVAGGIGGVLWENMAYADQGSPLASTFMDYLIPSAPELPEIECGHIETPSNTEGGFKGMGKAAPSERPPQWPTLWPRSACRSTPFPSAPAKFSGSYRALGNE